MNEAEESLARAERRDASLSESTFATDHVLRSGLREPFPPELIGKLPATAKRPALDYVGHAAVTDRLNQVAPGWTWSPVEWVTVEGNDGMVHLLAVIGQMTIGGVTRYEVGEVEKPSTFGDEAKKAVSNFIRRAAMRFGVALDLWAKEDLHSGAEQTLDGQAPDGAAAVGPGDDRLGKAVDADAAAAPQSVNGSGSEYINAEEAKVLAKVYGGQAALLKAARAKYGEHIRRAMDITRDQGQTLAEDIIALAAEGETDGYGG